MEARLAQASRAEPQLEEEGSDMEDNSRVEELKLKAPVQSREQERREAIQEWKQAKGTIDGEPFIVSTRVNGIYYAKTLVDSRCLAYSTVSQRFARKWRLERISITPRPLMELISTTKSAISKVAYIDINLNGH